jgi:hypothetical protein
MRAEPFDAPYKHWLLSGVVGPDLIAAARRNLPPVDSPGWVRYDNPLERGKWAMEDRRHLPVAWYNLLGALEAPELVADLSRLVGVPLRPDPDRRGAGLHLMFPGAYLGTHADYALHPSGLERRVNLILACGECSMGHGGPLSLCDPAGRPITNVYLGADVRRVYEQADEQAGRYFCGAAQAVAWECGDETYHGVGQLHGDAGVRVTAACYYLAEPRPGCVRRRALFLPPRPA